jgi:hypothetical protein
LPKEALTKADLWIDGHTHNSICYVIDFQGRQVKGDSQSAGLSVLLLFDPDPRRREVKKRKREKK